MSYGRALHRARKKHRARLDRQLLEGLYEKMQQRHLERTYDMRKQALFTGLVASAGEKFRPTFIDFGLPVIVPPHYPYIIEPVIE